MQGVQAKIFIGSSKKFYRGRRILENLLKSPFLLHFALKFFEYPLFGLVYGLAFLALQILREKFLNKIFNFAQDAARLLGSPISANCGQSTLDTKLFCLIFCSPNIHTSRVQCAQREVQTLYLVNTWLHVNPLEVPGSKHGKVTLFRIIGCKFQFFNARFGVMNPYLRALCSV